MEKLSALEVEKLKVDIKTLKKKIHILKYVGSSIEERFQLLDLKGDLELSRFLLKQDAELEEKAKVGFETPTKPKRKPRAKAAPKTPTKD